MLAAVQEVKAAGCNALTVFLGNFGSRNAGNADCQIL